MASRTEHYVAAQPSVGYHPLLSLLGLGKTMSMKGDHTNHVRWPGRLIGLLLFAFGGLPIILGFLLGERACDVGAGQPCTIGWGTRLLIVLLSAVMVCSGTGWIVNRLINSVRDDAS